MPYSKSRLTLPLVFASALLISGCSLWQDFTNWSYRTGEKLPVKEGYERCGDNLCLRGNSGAAASSASGKYMPAENMQPQGMQPTAPIPAPTGTPTPVPATSPASAPLQPVPMQPVQPIPTQPAPAQLSPAQPAAPVPAKPAEEPQAFDPSFEPRIQPDPQVPDSQALDTTGMSPEAIKAMEEAGLIPKKADTNVYDGKGPKRDDQLYPHEANPEWKKDAEKEGKTPLDEIAPKIGW